MFDVMLLTAIFKLNYKWRDVTDGQTGKPKNGPIHKLRFLIRIMMMCSVRWFWHKVGRLRLEMVWKKCCWVSFRDSGKSMWLKNKINTLTISNIWSVAINVNVYTNCNDGFNYMISWYVQANEPTRPETTTASNRKKQLKKKWMDNA